MKKMPLVIGILLFWVAVLSYSSIPAQAEPEPNLVTILNTFGFNNIAATSVQKFSADTYNISLLAEFAGYYDQNSLSYYQVGTSVFNLIFSGPEGGFGYVIPPTSKSFTINYQFGLSLFSGDGHRYFTETSRNTDGYQHAKVYENLDVPGMYFIGFENMYGMQADRDFNDMVVSLCPVPQYQITFNQTGVGTDFTGTVVTVDGTGYGVGALPKSFWWNKGSSHSFSFSSPLVVTSNSKQYVWNSTSGLSSLQSGSITVSTSGIVMGTYKTQYYLNVISSYDTPGGMGWYYSGNNAYATLTTGTLDHGNGTRRIFTDWSGDASGTNYAQSNPILMNSPKTATANWKTQYRLIVRTNGLGTQVTDVYNGTTVLGTATDATPYTDWFDKDSLVLLSIDSPITDGSMRFVFTQWSGDATGTSQPVSVTLSTAKDITANYKTQYQITVTAAPSGAIGGTFKVTYTQCGTTYTNLQKITTWTEWVDASTAVTASEPQDIINVSPDTRYKFDSYNPSASVTMDQSKSITLVYKTQYLLSVLTDPTGLSPQPTRNPLGEAGPADGWWYDASANVTLAAQTVSGCTFNYWDVDSVSRGNGVNPISVIMGAAHTATAHYITGYLVVFNQTGLDGTATGIVVTINGTAKTLSQLPNSTWLDSGALINYFYSDVSSTVSGKRFILANVTGPASPFIVTSNVTITGNYKAQYRLIMSTNFGTTDPSVGEHWYNESSLVPISATASSVVDGERYVWLGWAGTGTISYTGMDNPASVTMNSPVNQTAAWRHEYRLTMATNYGVTTPSVGDHWYEAGSIVAISATPPSTIDGECYVWNGWTGIGTISYTGMDNSGTVTMNSPITQTASWTLQYRLTMIANYGTTSPSVGEHWYDAGTVVTIQAFAPSVVPGERYVWNGWTGTGTDSYTGTENPSSVTLNGPIGEIASWTHQFLLTIQTNGLPSAYPTNVYLGGSQSGTASDATPYTKWFDSGTPTETIGVDNTVSGATGTRYLFVRWVEDSSTNNPRASETMSAPKVFTAQYKTQYLLIVGTDPTGLSPQPTRNPLGEAGPADGWWYDASANVTLAAQTVSGCMFLNWDVDAASQGSGVNPITVRMNSPHTATAYYTPPPQVPVGGYSISLTKQSPESHVAAYVALIALFAAALGLTKRKRK